MRLHAICTEATLSVCVQEKPRLVSRISEMCDNHEIFVALERYERVFFLENHGLIAWLVRS